MSNQSKSKSIFEMKNTIKSLSALWLVPIFPSIVMISDSIFSTCCKEHIIFHTFPREFVTPRKLSGGREVVRRSCPVEVVLCFSLLMPFREVFKGSVGSCPGVLSGRSFQGSVSAGSWNSRWWGGGGIRNASFCWCSYFPRPACPILHLLNTILHKVLHVLSYIHFIVYWSDIFNPGVPRWIWWVGSEYGRQDGNSWMHKLLLEKTYRVFCNATFNLKNMYFPSIPMWLNGHCHYIIIIAKLSLHFPSLRFALHQFRFVLQKSYL